MTKVTGMPYVTEDKVNNHRFYDFTCVEEKDLPDIVKKCFDLCYKENIHPAYGLDNEYYHIECQDILMAYLKRIGHKDIADMYKGLTSNFWYC